MNPISSVTAPKLAAPAEESKETKRLAEAAHQFEAVFVRSMLEQTGAFGKKDAYGDLAVSTLADSVTKGGGLGLGELIRRAVTDQHARTNGGGR